MHFRGHAERKQGKYGKVFFLQKTFEQKKLLPKNCTDFFEKENLIKSTMFGDVTMGGRSTFQNWTSLHPGEEGGQGPHSPYILGVLYKKSE